MDNGKQIISYLEELAQVLKSLQVRAEFHILIAGGAYMMLQMKKRRFTEDIDFAIIEQPRGRPGNRPFRIAVERAEIARNMVPCSVEFKQAVALVARRHKGLLEDWINDEAAVYLYDDAPVAEGTFWRAFGNLLYVYLPTAEYILATKIAAGRQKDMGDIQVLLRELRITTYEQARAIVDKFLLPDAQTFWEVEDKLEALFP